MICIKNTNKLINYQNAINEMLEIVDKIINEKHEEVIWFLQHEDVYTIGVSGSESDILDKNVKYIHANRGGKVTYHGEGQLVVYLMLNISKRFNNDVHKYVKYLENCIILSLNKIGISAYIKDKFVGVWVKDGNLEKKIASIGIRIKKSISYHGIAINISPDLSKFNRIIPCGVTEFDITSVKSLGFKTNVEDFSNILQNELQELNNIL